MKDYTAINFTREELTALTDLLSYVQMAEESHFHEEYWSEELTEAELVDHVLKETDCCHPYIWAEIISRVVKQQVV